MCGQEQAAIDRQAAINCAIAALERRFGPGIVYRLAQARPKVGALALATGAFGLDRATGIGGVPRGRISELFGPPSCGKTTLAYHILANAQLDSGLAAFIDGAQAMDGEAMLTVGVNLDELLVVVPFDAGEALEIAEILARCRALDAIVVAGLSSFWGAGGVNRRLLEAIRKLNVALRDSPTALVFVNEGMLKGALPFYASLRVALAPLRALRAPGGEVVGLRVQASVVKNKLAQPGGRAEFVIRERGGVDRAAELFELSLAHSLLEELPLGLAYGGTILGKSRPQAIAYLARTPEMVAKLERRLQEVTKWPGSAMS